MQVWRRKPALHLTNQALIPFSWRSHALSFISGGRLSYQFDVSHSCSWWLSAGNAALTATTRAISAPIASSELRCDGFSHFQSSTGLRGFPTSLLRTARILTINSNRFLTINSNRFSKKWLLGQGSHLLRELKLMSVEILPSRQRGFMPAIFALVSLKSDKCTM
jgi:hypothetical protein